MAKNINQGIHDENKILNLALRQTMGDFIENAANTVTNLSKFDPVSYSDKEQLLSYFNAVQAGNKQYLNIYFGDLNGKLTLVPQSSAAEDLDARTREWYKDAKDQDKLIFSNVYTDAVTQKPVITIACPVKDKNQQLVGVLGIDVSLDQVNNMINQQKLGETGYSYISDNQGKMIIHPDPERIGLDMSERDYVKNALAGKEGSANYLDSKGSKKVVYYSMIPMANWGLFVQQTESEAYRVMNNLIKNQTIITIPVLIISVFISLLLAGKMVGSLQLIEQEATRISQGDLTETLTVTSKDELGRLTKVINTMTVNLKELIAKVQESVSEVSGTCGNLTNITLQTTEANTRITQEITEVAASIEQISAASQEVSASSQEALARVNLGQAKVKETMILIKEISNSSHEVAQAIQEVDNKAKEIGKIVDMITQVAEQTNLLALNAAIEAARAGDQGRGFAIVAEEVRKLSEQTASATKDIAFLVNSMQSGATTAVSKMNNEVNLADQGANSVADAGTLFNEIQQVINNLTTQIQQTSQATLGITNSVQNLAAGSQENTAAQEEVSSNTEKLNQMAANLAGLIAKFKV